MLQRLLDRLQRRQRVIRLLLARQPMLRQTVVGRRMVRAYRYTPPEPSAYFAAGSEFLQPQLGVDQQFEPPPIAELLPEPFSDAPVQPPARLPAPPAVATRQQPTAIPAVEAPAASVRQPAPVARPQPTAARQQAPVTALEPSAPGVDAEPSPTADQQSLPALVDQPTQLAPPIADRVAPTHVPPIADLVVPTTSEAPASPEAPQAAPAAPTLPARRRRGQFVELPVSPEVARSLAQAAGDRSPAGQPPAQSVAPVEGVPARAAVPAQTTAAELFTSTPARSPEEWGRMLAGEANPQIDPEVPEAPSALPPVVLPAAEADAEPALAPDLAAEVEAVDLAAPTEAVEPAAPDVAPMLAQLSAEAVEPAETATTIDAAAAPAAAPAHPAEPTFSAAPMAEGVPSLEALLQAATAPLRSVSAEQPDRQAAAPTVPVQSPQPSPVPVAGQPSTIPAPVPTAPVAVPTAPASAAMQRTIERVSEVLRREAQAAQQESVADILPADHALRAAATAATQVTGMADNPVLASTPNAVPQDARTAASQPLAAPHIEPGAPAPHALANPAAEVVVPQSALPQSTPAAEPPAASAPERPPSRRSRFEEIPASARQPAPTPPAPTGERRLNPRPWIPQRPGDAPAGPRISDELFQEENGRSPQDWSRLLFEATHPQAWKRLPEPEPAPPVTPAAQPPAPTSRPTTAVPQRQDVNRPVPTRVGRPSETAAFQPRAQPLPTAQATPLRDSTRRFLRPIVGIDPGDVRIYRGAEGARITEALGAEGASTGDTIALGPGHEDESRPQTLGLLAHELTHTARSSDAQFVPPIAQGGLAPAAGEEQVARAAERQAVQAARRFVAPSIPTVPTIPAPPLPDQSAAPSGLWGNGPAETIEAQDRSYWGELPAPWEPLPDWMNGPSQTPNSQYAGGPLSSAPTPAFPTSPSEFASGDAVPAVPATYLAEIDREIQSGETQAQSSPQPQQAAPAPDLDAMARQVYDMLKQRLAAERRRLG